MPSEGFSAADIAAKVEEVATRSAGQQTAVPLSQYEQAFAAADPHLCAARSGVAFDPDASCFSCQVLGDAVEVAWPGMQARYALEEGAGAVPADAPTPGAPDVPSVHSVSDAPGPSEVPTKVRILLACLILRGQLVPSTGKFLAYGQMPAGDYYFKAFEGRCIARLGRMFGGDVGRFSAACEAAGGRASSDGDASFDFEFVPGVFVRLALWAGDDEAPSRAQITFSDNAALAFSAEELAAVCDVCLGKVQAADRDRRNG